MSQPDYFDALYQDNSDPWHYQTRWYEQRKRAISLAILPRAEYVSAIELGCSNGVFSQEIASRCGSLLCLDGNAQAVTLAKQRLQNLSHIRVEQAKIPQDLPQQNFDLMIIGEILYYLPQADIHAVIDWAKRSLNPNGTLLCCHWRYAIDGFKQTGESVQNILQAELNAANGEFFQQVDLIDADFLLGVWQKADEQRAKNSVAKNEGLI